MTVRLRHRARVLVGAVVLLGTLAACGSSGTTSTPPPPATSSSSPPASSQPVHGSGGNSSPAAATDVITIKNFSYAVPTSVKPGAKVTVKNDDQVNHTVTADQSDSLFNVTVPSNGGTATFTAPSKPGRYKFHCNFHANMHGVLVVS